MNDIILFSDRLKYRINEGHISYIYSKNVFGPNRSGPLLLCFCYIITQFVNTRHSGLYVLSSLWHHVFVSMQYGCISLYAILPARLILIQFPSFYLADNLQFKGHAVISLRTLFPYLFLLFHI